MPANMPARWILVAIAFLLPACGSSRGLEPCPPASAAVAEPDGLPGTFPTPDGVTYTGSREAGPSVVVEGHLDGELRAAYDAYLAAFPPAGYAVVFDEIEATDAEVNFDGHDTTGQVRLNVRCEGRTDVMITIRPA